MIRVTAALDERHKGHRLALAGIILAFVILGVIYSFVNPLFESSDEHWHFADNTMNRRNDNKNLFIHPPGQAFFFSGTVLATRLLCWFSVLLGVVTVLCTHGIARYVMPGQRDVALAAAATVAFTPQFIFVRSSVTNDSAAAALTSLYLLLLIRAIKLHLLAMPVTFSPGPYRLRVGLYDPASGERVDSIERGLSIVRHQSACHRYG